MDTYLYKYKCPTWWGTVSGFKQKMIILGVVILILFLTALYFLFKGGNSGGSSDSGDFY